MILVRTSFRIEEVYNRQEDCVQDSPDDPELPADILDANWSDFDDGEVCYPLGSRDID